MSAPLGVVVLDHTALLALGKGSRLLSGLVVAAHAEHGRYVYTPALCLAAAVAQRTGLADHLGALPAVQVIDLDYSAAATVGGFMAAGADWRDAQAIAAGRPTPDWPAGRPILSTAPGTYAGWGVQVITVA